MYFVPFLFLILLLYVAWQERRAGNVRDAKLAGWLAGVMGMAGVAMLAFVQPLP